MSEKDIGWGVYHVVKTRYYSERLHSKLKALEPRDGDTKKEVTILRAAIEAYREYDMSMNDKILTAVTHFRESESDPIRKMIDKAEREVISQAVAFR
jgi:hypothetical protein